MVTIRKLNLNDLDKLTELYEECFLTDHYFKETFDNYNLNDLIYGQFKSTFEFIINKCIGYGLFINEIMIGLLLAFDYHDVLKKYPSQFTRIFTLEENPTVLPYYNQIHKNINKNKNVIYLLAIGIKPEHRNKGYASILLDELINHFKSYTFFSDVSNNQSLKLYEKRGFSISLIDEDYYLVKKIN